MTIRSRFGLAVVAGIILTGCSYSNPTSPITTTNNYVPSAPVARSSSVTIPSGSLKLTVADSDTTVNATVGQTLAITLPSNQTTGYSWNLVTNPDATIVSKTSSAYAATPAPKGVVGSGGNEVWLFTAKKAGTTNLKLAYAHAWEINKSTTQTFNLTVVVK